MHNSLKNKKIIVTGASSGLGKRLALQIAKNGGIPIMLARSTQKLQEQQKQILREFSMESFFYTVDLQNKNEIDSTAELLFRDHGQLHALINNAGQGVFNYIQDADWEEIEKMIQLNLLAVIRFSQLFVSHFQQYGQGHIINIGSQAGKISTPKSSVYGASKHAVIGFTNALRLEVAAKNIRVTAVNLGPVRTNFFTLADPDGTYQKNVENYMLNPDHVASKVVQSLFTNKREINLPWWMEFGSRIYQVFPGIIERLLRSQFNKK